MIHSVKVIYNIVLRGSVVSQQFYGTNSSCSNLIQIYQFQISLNFPLTAIPMAQRSINKRFLLEELNQNISLLPIIRRFLRFFLGMSKTTYEGDQHH